MDADGLAHSEHYVPGQPSGLGWLPDGRLLAVSSFDRKLVTFVEEDRPLVVHSDLIDIARSPLNDMLVTPSGHAYVGTFGWNSTYEARPDDCPAQLICARPDGSAFVAAKEMQVPNGMALIADGTVLVVAETSARRLTAFDVGPDGELGGRRLFADVESAPDGICADSDGNIWAACPFAERFVLIAPGGEVLNEAPTPGRWAISCVLDPSGEVLYGATAEVTHASFLRGQARGGIERLSLNDH